MINQTIAAISTPLGPGGIGIIRISGPDAIVVLRRLFRPKQAVLPSISPGPAEFEFSSHRVYYGFIAETDSQTIIDEVLAIYMQKPRSFTREDVVEIHSHSGFVVLDRILSAVVDAGARLATPGEFTKKAFLNGRIDLSQAEAVIDLINAPCEKAAQLASQQVVGGIRDLVEQVNSDLAGLQATCEASIEFGEDISQDDHVDAVKQQLEQEIIPTLFKLIQRQKDASIYRNGLQLAIAGVPNVGKSSLLNKLVHREIAIVSEEPGTTRDIVRDYISINGVPIVVCDTAGIHETSDPIECLGIKKARDQIREADIILLILDGSRPINDGEEKLIAEFSGSKTIVVSNKDDIADEDAIVTTVKQLKGMAHIRVSAKFGKNLDQLKKQIFSDVVSGNPRDGKADVTPNLRQRKIIEEAVIEIKRALTGQHVDPSADLLSEGIDRARRQLGEITGNRGQEDLYNHIFSQFCIGK